jgi:hypothetical protein
MSKMTQEVKNMRAENKAKNSNKVMNFMGGISYEINPLDTMKMITASSIFGEPQYYRSGEFAEKTIVRDGSFHVDKLFEEYSIFSKEEFSSLKTSDIMEKVIDEALRYDFAATLDWAITLRNEYFMRLNPQIIMVRAAMLTDERIAFTQSNPKKFTEVNMKVMKRADDVIAQVTYYIYKNKDKAGIPGILKRSWKKKVDSLSAYEVYKYKNQGIGLIDTVRICHANNNIINELMKNGTIAMDEKDKTWETLRASGMSWENIIKTINMNHMALLRNLRGIFSEIDDLNTTMKLLERLEGGVKKGMQFPFRYMNALKNINNECNNSTLIKDSLEKCLDISCENLPHFAGNNAFLSDNSGSAWDACNSEYGSVKVAEIDNLSAVIGAANSDKGSVFAFGDTLIEFPISKREGILKQAKEISKTAKAEVGGSTENGIWLFFKKAIDEKIVYDNIFIFSDQQAGHGGLYGTDEDSIDYKRRGYSVNYNHIDVARLINDYRKNVNPKVNVFSVQTAGYNNVLVPEYGYRTNILYGWTGKELVFAKAMNDFWDAKDKGER